jgi:hypothetical protein
LGRPNRFGHHFVSWKLFTMVFHYPGIDWAAQMLILKPKVILVVDETKNIINSNFHFLFFWKKKQVIFFHMVASCHGHLYTWSVAVAINYRTDQLMRKNPSQIGVGDNRQLKLYTCQIDQKFFNLWSSPSFRTHHHMLRHYEVCSTECIWSYKCSVHGKRFIVECIGHILSRWRIDASFGLQREISQGKMQ